ncbi:JmjC domain-containing protein [Jatrophihabitans sp. GAS493]|uniref:cupin domain-containing protein n=1 Tax=Jatrophihabitans sp. GAS493 TaxID=1907575 RepID=UPI000BB8B20A
MLARCIALSNDEFAENHWGNRPLLTLGRELPRSFGDLFDAAAVDELVSRRGLRTPFLRMAKDGSVLDSKRFTRSGGAGATAPDQVADDRVLEQLAGGATLVLQALHRTWPPLVDFGSSLAAELGHPVQINAYITPPQNQGFAAHYDVHDVFVLQISGRKRWRIHEPVLRDPLPDQPWEQRKDAVAERSREEPIIDTVLEPGDSLYLPRGFLHSASALGDTSIHLTVGVHPVTRASLVTALLAAARREESLRASLPMGRDLGDPETLAPPLRATVLALQQWLEGADAADVAKVLDADLTRAMRPAPLAPLAQLAAADALTAETPLQLRPALRARASSEADAVRLQLIDRSISLPLSAEAAVKWVLTGNAFTPAELPGLDADEQLVVARRLLREAVVVPAPGQPAPRA